MTLIVCKWLAASSLLLNALAVAETRPQYGGTLHVATGATIATLDPADRTQPDSFARNSITTLVFDTLVRLDNAGRAQPSLAVSWESSPDNKRWSVRIRGGIVFQDGSAMTAEAVAASLRLANPTWNVLPEAGSVTIQSETPVPSMPATLALPRNAIVKRGADHGLSGTGPFRVTDWQPAKKLTLTANEECWRGRPYLDAIEIELGRSNSDRMAAVESGRSGLIDLPVEMSRRATSSSYPSASSPPMELIAVVFTRDAQGPDDLTLRNALALSLDRTSIHNVLLQGAGDAQGGVLPDWMTGYGALFPSQADLPRAKALRRQAQSAPAWTLKYDASDTLLRLLAERIALNAKDAGLVVKPVSDGVFDARIIRIVLPSTDAWVDLGVVGEASGVPVPGAPNLSLEELYKTEQRMLSARRVIPLLHLPAVYASTKALRSWSAGATGTCQLADAWLEPSAP